MSVNEIEAVALRACASVIVTGRVFTPVVLLAGTVAWKEKTLLPAVTSPFVPLSKNCCVAEPPILPRSAVTASPVLVGNTPGITVTVSNVPLPTTTVEGLALPVPDGEAEVTVSEIGALPLRACASVMVVGIDLPPTLVPEVTVAWNEKTLSPAVTSPFVPSSKNCCVAEPPIPVRLPVTARPVLVKLVPGVTVTLSNVLPPWAMDEGAAVPTPEGLVLTGVPLVGTKAIPRNAVLVAAVASVVILPLLFRLNPLESVSLFNEVPFPVKYSVTVLPFAVPVIPRKEVGVPETVLFNTQEPETSEYFWMPPPLTAALSSAT